MPRDDKVRTFRDLHVAGRPLVLYNIWDAGSARAVERAGADALATGSASVAGAHGYEDGEALPFDRLLWIVERIAAMTALPLSVDFERGYAEDAGAVAMNALRLVEAGAVGVNLEDGLQAGGLRKALEQAQRIEALRNGLERAGASLFINARTDVFLQSKPDEHAGLVETALQRAEAYRSAGADGLFVPGLTDYAAMKRVCDASPAPVNAMVLDDAPLAPLAACGVARISFGPAAFLRAQDAMTVAAQTAFATL
ncbi:MAG: isocitrate lyase/phosphoenolpyruvate mutase family protein [Pseudomonadota bacterium]